MDNYDDPNFVFTYDETSPSCLRWRYVKPKDTHNSIGGVVGRVNGDGRWTVNLNRSPRLIHRVVLEMFGESLGCQDTVHFKDGDGLNTRISNLYIKRYADKNATDKYLVTKDWKKCFDYFEGQLYWKEDRWSGNSYRKLDALEGDPLCPKEDRQGYLKASIKANRGSIRVRVHRLVYEWHYGPIPDGMEIDHINGIRNDNRIQNIRLVSSTTNARNRARLTRNTTGVTGVSTNRNCSYVATWMVNGKNVCKYFSWSKYGKEKAFDLACKARKDAIRKLNEEYGEEGYTEDHGERVLD